MILEDRVMDQSQTMRPPLDPPLIVAYVLKMFPRFSETFILNEILELERRGVRIIIFSMNKFGPIYITNMSFSTCPNKTNRNNGIFITI